MALTWYYKKGGTGTYLTQAQIDNNMKCAYGKLSSYGFSLEAVAGMIGCFMEESRMNPGIYETAHQSSLDDSSVYFAGGVGLAQWTDYPAYTASYPNPLLWSANKEGKNWWDGNFQCWLLNQANNSSYTAMGYGQGSRWGWQKVSGYYTWNWDYFKSYTGSVTEACMAWFYEFEWHGANSESYLNSIGVSLSNRRQWAQYAYDLLNGLSPEVPGGSTDPEGGDEPGSEDPSDPGQGAGVAYRNFICAMLHKKRGGQRARRTILLRL